jgi:hypothetical protein
LKSFFEEEWGKTEINGGDDPNWTSIYAYMEVSQQNPLYNYHIITKCLKEEQ